MSIICQSVGSWPKNGYGYGLYPVNGPSVQVESDFFYSYEICVTIRPVSNALT